MVWKSAFAAGAVMGVACACSDTVTGVGKTGVDKTGTHETGVDASVKAEDSTPCDVAGQYDVTWTPSVDDKPECVQLSAVLEITEDGLDTGAPAYTCGFDGCDQENCKRVAVGAACKASLTVQGPCAGLVVGRELRAGFDYTGERPVFTFSDTRGDCASTGVGVRR